LRLLLSFFAIFSAVLYIYTRLIDFKLETKTPKMKKKLYLILLALSFAVVAVLCIAGFTAALSPDVENQYKQAINNTYDNWHPVAHTFLFFKVPTLIFGESYESVLAFQYLFSATIIVYLIWSLYKFGCKKHIILIAAVLLLLNNKLRYIMKFPWKDIPFSFSLLFLTINLMWIYFTKGEWLKNKGNLALFILSILLTLFLRHNGILAVVPTVLVLLIAYKGIRKLVMVISASVLALYFLITIPLYSLLGIEGHSQSFAESMGVPNNQLCYIVKNYGIMSEEEREFINNVIPVGVIKYHYEIGDFNTIKWLKNKAGTAYYYDGDFIQENQAEYIKTWFSVIRKNPKLAFEGYYYATRELWISRLGISDVLTYNVGMGFFIATFMIAVAAFRDKRRLVPYIPLLFNMLGIMLLVTGGEIRFVFANLVCGVPLALFALIPQSGQSVGDETAVKV
jgi:hypothetical protein